MSTTLEDWHEASVAALEEIAATMLESKAAKGPLREEVCPQGMVGSYITIYSNHTTVRTGVVCSMTHCRALSEAVLNPEGTITMSDIVDSHNELANILAGRLKARMIHTDPDLRLGLPVFIEGRILPTNEMHTLSQEIRLGVYRVHLVSITHRLYASRNAQLNSQQKAAS